MFNDLPSAKYLMIYEFTFKINMTRLRLDYFIKEVSNQPEH